MPKRDDGGYAFSQALGHSNSFVGCEGMSLRDYFAAQFAVGFFDSDLWLEGADAAAEKANIRLPEMIAAKAYEYADAMLAERQKE